MKQLSTIIFILWSILYILHDMKVVELFDMDIIPLPVIIIFYIAILTSGKKIIN